MKVNDGTLVNQGLEFTLTGHIVNKEDFYFDISLNGEMLKNELTRMPFDEVTGKDKILDTSEAGFGRATGHSLYDFYMREWAGVNPDTGALDGLLTIWITIIMVNLIQGNKYHHCMILWLIIQMLKFQQVLQKYILKLHKNLLGNLPFLILEEHLL
jgi:hypothetical protein